MNQPCPDKEWIKWFNNNTYGDSSQVDVSNWSYLPEYPKCNGTLNDWTLPQEIYRY